MSRSRGEISTRHLNSAYPHQVALPYERCTQRNYDPAHSAAHALKAYWRHRSVSDGSASYLVFCFQELDAASEFRRAFDGIPFYPEDLKGKLWTRPLGDIRRPGKSRDLYDFR